MLVTSFCRAALPLVLLIALSGCGNYTVTFELDRVVNAWTGSDIPREPLEIDIVCLTKDEAEKYSGIVSGRVTSAEWFGERHGDFKFEIASDHIFSLRSGDLADRRDRKLRDSLLSPEDGGERRVTVHVKHSACLSSGSAVVIFAGFRDATGGGYAKTRPVVLSPAPRGNTDIVIGVGKKAIVLRGAD